MVDTYVPPSYPVLRFIATHGMKLAAALGVLVVLAGLAAAVAMQSVIVGASALLGAVVLWGLLASYAEMVRVIVDMLVPR